jgi:hypothetical protein
VLTAAPGGKRGVQLAVGRGEPLGRYLGREAILPQDHVTGEETIPEEAVCANGLGLAQGGPVVPLVHQELPPHSTLAGRLALEQGSLDVTQGFDGAEGLAPSSLVGERGDEERR